MISIFDRHLIKFYKQRLHSTKRKQVFIRDGITYFKKVHFEQKKKFFARQRWHFEAEELEPTPVEIKVVLERLVKETVRVYAIIDPAILEANVTRARWLFWFSFIPSLLFAVLGYFYSDASTLTLLAPMLLAVTTWVSRLITIPILYSLRVQGGMESVAETYVFELYPVALEDLLIDIEPSVDARPVVIEIPHFVENSEDAVAITTAPVVRNRRSTTLSMLDAPFLLFNAANHTNYVVAPTGEAAVGKSSTF